MKMMTEKIHTDPWTRQLHSNKLSRYLGMEGVGAIQGMHELVEYLLRDNKINNLKQKYGVTEYDKKLESLRSLNFQYIKASTLAQEYLKVDDKDLKRKKMLDEALTISCKQIAIAQQTLWDFFYELINKTDLVGMNINVYSARVESRRKSYYKPEDDFIGN